jgi:hypothetical protein
MLCKAQLPVCCSFQNPKHARRKVVIAHVRHNITPDQRSGQQGALFQEPIIGMSGSGVEHRLGRGLLMMHDRRTDPRREKEKIGKAGELAREGTARNFEIVFLSIRNTNGGRKQHA